MALSLDEIKYARDIIRTKMIEKLQEKGGENFTSLNGNDIEHLFNLYDSIFFQDQIIAKISESGSYIQFFSRSRKSGVIGLCGKKYIDGVVSYYMDIAPNVLATTLRSNASNLPTVGGMGCRDRLGCLQIVIEHELIHLLAILWGYSGSNLKPSDPNYRVYSSHGLLFQCMIKSYFGHTRFQHLGLTSVIEVPEPTAALKNTVANNSRFLKYMQSKKPAVGGGFENWAQSCYIDSLLMVILESISAFWRKNIMDADVDNTDYSSRTTNINNSQKLKKYAKLIQQQIKDDYDVIHNDRKIIKCVAIRTLLSNIIPQIRERGSWVLFNPGPTYDALVDLFPDLTLNIPIQMHRWIDIENAHISDSVEYRNESFLTMWDYLDPLTNTEDKHDYKEIRWDLVDSPVLVFYNGATPRIRDFSSMGREKSYNYVTGDISGKRQRYDFDVVKARAFGESIIDSRYKLIGVITLEGVSPVNEGGSHYTSYFKALDGNWYHYNDIGARIERVETLPEIGVWKEGGGKMPSMYFYVKVKQPYEDPIPKLSDPKPSAPKIERYTGTNFDYNRIESRVGNEVSYMYYVTDKTKGRLAPIFDRIGKVYSVVDESKYLIMWNVEPQERQSFEDKLKSVDSKFTIATSTSYLPAASTSGGGGSIKGTVTIKRGIDSVKYGNVYKKYNDGNVYNYSARSFLVLSDHQIPYLSDAMILKNLDYGLKGVGHLYSKDRLREIEERMK